MDAALSERQTLNGGAEEQLAASPKPPKTRCAPEVVIVSRCAGCYKQHKRGVKSAGSSEELDRSSSSSEDDDDYEREGAPPAGGAREQEGRRGERRSKTADAETHPEDGASAPTPAQPSPAGDASQP